MIDEATVRLRPSPAQLAWQRSGVGAFFHIGPSTFNDHEWSDGTDDPRLFAPTDLDTDQWLATAASFGARYAVLTAKHHDGFCLWPTATTPYSLAASGWRNGGGDLVGEFARSCRRYGIGFGLYLSPWDRHAPQYPDPAAYDELYCAQLTELLTGYGPVTEIWFDGAGSEGRTYDWARIDDLCKGSQPDAMRFNLGDATIRWIGNEDGMATDPVEYVVDTPDGLRYRPPECDVSIRDGWFHHDTEQPKSVGALTSIHARSVGLGAGLLLNLPPDRRGLVDPRDVAVCTEFGRILADERSRTTPVPLMPVGTGRWQADLGPGPVSGLVLAEDLTGGQRVRTHRISADDTTVVEAGTIGVRRVHRVPELGLSGRIEIEVDAVGSPTLSLAAIRS
jgi:alpha-L-fucosidase